MPSLICDVKNCSYNEENYCCLSAIQVGNPAATNNLQTYCKNFNEGSYIASNCAKEKQPLVDVKCEANQCIHNVGSVCMAECIPITGTSTACCNVEDTLCGAFVSQ